MGGCDDEATALADEEAGPKGEGGVEGLGNMVESMPGVRGTKGER
jgi:hypothetical protein